MLDNIEPRSFGDTQLAINSFLGKGAQNIYEYNNLLAALRMSMEAAKGKALAIVGLSKNKITDSYRVAK